MKDESTYGFNRQDADDLIDIIADGDIEFAEVKPASEGGSAEIRYFVLTTDLTVGTPDTATANLFDPVDETTARETGVNLILNAKMFADLANGDCGICMQNSDGTWVAVNAPWQGP